MAATESAERDATAEMRAAQALLARSDPPEGAQAVALPLFGAAPRAPDAGAWEWSMLQSLPGIGPVRARQIVAARHAGGFAGRQAPEAWDELSGIGPRTVQRVRESLEASGGGAYTSAPVQEGEVAAASDRAQPKPSACGPASPDQAPASRPSRRLDPEPQAPP